MKNFMFAILFSMSPLTTYASPNNMEKMESIFRFQTEEAAKTAISNLYSVILYDVVTKKESTAIANCLLSVESRRDEKGTVTFAMRVAKTYPQVSTFECQSLLNRGESVLMRQGGFKHK